MSDCERFQRDFNHWIDQQIAQTNREDARSDQEFQHAHLDQCELCRREAESWLALSRVMSDRIEPPELEASVLPPEKASAISPRSRAMSLSAIAATFLCWIVFSGRHNPTELASPSTGNMFSEVKPRPPQDFAGVDAAVPAVPSEVYAVASNGPTWLVDSTLPTLTVLSEGVSPLGRTLQRAAQLLAGDGGDKQLPESEMNQIKTDPGLSSPAVGRELMRTSTGSELKTTLFSRGGVGSHVG
ncbi:MAG: hypothetical protein AAGD07_15735 [Planctomycetota bacterium]